MRGITTPEDGLQLLPGGLDWDAATAESVAPKAPPSSPEPSPASAKRTGAFRALPPLSRRAGLQLQPKEPREAT